MRNLTFLLFLFICLSSCTLLYREVRYYDADITDHKIFPYTEVSTGSSPYYFEQGDKNIFDTLRISFKSDSCKTLSQIIAATSTHAFIVIRNDSILFENYYHDYTRDKISTVFSVSKSITSLLIGIAIDEGLIDDVHDPVTKYIPELKGRDPGFEKLSIEHLLDMRSSMKYNESYSNPFSHMARLYYGTNQLNKLKRMKFEYEPGSHHSYQSSSTALLGIIVENVSGKELGKYLEEKVWMPMGMENKATWSLDDKRNRSAKAFGGLNATAIDLAKIARLHLHNGTWNNQKIVSEHWVEESSSPNMDNNGYQYQWWSFNGAALKDGERYFSDSISAAGIIEEVYKGKYQHFKVWNDKNAPDSNKPWRVNIYTGSYYALGIMKQLVYIDPQKNLIMVRLGRTGDMSYEYFCHKLSKYL